MEQILVPTPREIASREGKRLKKVIKKFDDSLNKSKTQFDKIHEGINSTEDYFTLAMDDIEFEINEDRRLSLREVKNDYHQLKMEMLSGKQKLKQLSKKIENLHEPPKFPFTLDQMKKIVDEKTKEKDYYSSKLKRILTNIYEYKANISYSNRMKIINSIIQK